MFADWSLLQGLGWLGYLISLAITLKYLPLDYFRTHKRVQHLVFGSAASVFFLWLFRAGIYDGLNVHFLWLTALLLTLGFRWAMISAFIALLGVTIVGKESWSMLGVNGLIGVVMPLSLSYCIYAFSFHKLPRHFFVYVFLCAFIPGGIMIALKMFVLGGFYFVDGQHEWFIVKDNYLVLIPLMLFPEAMLNGMTMTLLIIYRPQWVYTFYDKFYLHNK